MMKVSQVTYTEGRKTKQNVWKKQELISWSAKRSKKNALISAMLDIAHSKMKKEHLENYFKFFNC